MAIDHAIGPVSQIPPGEGRTFYVAGLRVAIFHTRSGQVHATQAECPHRGGPLADGLTDDTTVMCPLHDRAYAFATGEGIGTACTISLYPVRLSSDGEIVISV